MSPTRTFELKPKFIKQPTFPTCKRQRPHPVTESKKLPIYLSGAFDRLALHRYYSLCSDDRKRPPSLRAATFTPHPGDGALGHPASAFFAGGLETPLQGENAGLRVRHH